MSACVCMLFCARAYVYACMCVRELFLFPLLTTMWVCVCVCVEGAVGDLDRRVGLQLHWRVFVVDDPVHDNLCNL